MRSTRGPRRCEATMPDHSNLDDLKEIVSHLASATAATERILRARLGGEPASPLVVVEGQGRGSKKPPAKLAAVGSDDAA